MAGMNLAWFNKSVDDSLDDPPMPPGAEPHKGPPRALTANLTTPHDAILAGIYAQVGDTADEPVQGPHDDLRFLQAEPLHDAYDGSVVGHVVPSNPALHPETRITQGPPTKRDEQLWKQLSKVLDLQSQIASRHIQMEGIGTKSGDGKTKGKGAQSQINLWEAMGSTERIPADAPHVVDEDEGVELGPEADEEKRNREREAEFAKLAHQFEGRKEGITDIMDQLDQLSKALTKFHHLQAPTINFPADSSNSHDKERLSPMTSISTIVPHDPHPVHGLIINKMSPGTQVEMIESPLSSQDKFERHP